MKIISNNNQYKHEHTINSLLPTANKVILCSGWIKSNGIKMIEEALKQALQNHATITLYTNSEDTAPSAKRKISKIKGVRHVIVHNKYLHTKLYYFEHAESYTAIIGSANLTGGGLNKNEELSVELSGTLGDNNHKSIIEYLSELEKLR